MAVGEGVIILIATSNGNARVTVNVMGWGGY